MKHLHLYESDDELFHTARYDSGQVEEEWWTLPNRQLHREGEPASISYYQDGTKYGEYWYINGKYHREDGPAKTEYYPDGKIKYEAWLRNGEYHREDGPAAIDYTALGQVKSEYWYLNGHPYSETRWVNLMLDRWSDLELATIAMQDTTIGYLVRESGKVPDWAQIWIEAVR